MQINTVEKKFKSLAFSSPSLDNSEALTLANLCQQGPKECCLAFMVRTYQNKMKPNKKEFFSCSIDSFLQTVQTPPGSILGPHGLLISEQAYPGLCCYLTKV